MYSHRHLRPSYTSSYRYQTRTKFKAATRLARVSRLAPSPGFELRFTMYSRLHLRPCAEKILALRRAVAHLLTKTALPAGERKVGADEFLPRHSLDVVLAAFGPLNYNSIDSISPTQWPEFNRPAANSLITSNTWSENPPMFKTSSRSWAWVVALG
jgi:hypothetical protein